MYNTSSEGVIPIRSVREKYFFKKKLGKGGFCDVFLAENRESHMQVAIKMMEMKTASERIDRRVARFRREMMLYSQLNHPHIVKVLDSGETETGLLFIVFEYIQGKNLAQLLKKEGALSLDRTLNLMKQILSGLRTAHDKGIIHRDLKPENVMITQINGTEQAKILDFGISTFIAGQFGDMNRITATKEFLGTPAYAAPEQLRGEPVSQKVDIYAWGLLFLECITGKPPFSNPSVASIVQQQLTPSPIPLPAALSDHRLGTLLRWTLEKDADRRAGNCSVISSHLDNVSLDGISLNNGFIKGEPASNEAAGAVDFVVYETYVSSQERRQVTVVCFSLSMYEKEDFQFPDVLDEIYQDLVAHGLDLFKRFGAHVVSEGGDSILAFFGYPDASDTDARRAVRSALELATSIARRSMVFSNQHGIRFSYRIGIHTGMITVRKTGEGKPQLSGLTINCAARLCNAANADSIFISEGSYHLLKNIVECNEVPVETLPQFISNLHIFRIIGERHIECFGGIDRFAVSPMVGRDGELAQLFDIWKSIGKNNIGRAIMIQGEAGIGKSRLSAEFALMALRENGGWMECRCLPEGKNSALHPIIGFLYSYFGLSRASSPKNNATALEKQLTSFGIDCSIAMPLFCSWFGLQSDVYAIPTLSPQRQKEYMLDITAEILVKKALMSSSVIIPTSPRAWSSAAGGL